MRKTAGSQSNRNPWPNCLTTSKHFLTNLKQSSTGVIINISSDSGSLNCECTWILSMRCWSFARKVNMGQFLAYRMAKAAPNQQAITLAREMQKAEPSSAVVSLNPGFFATRLADLISMMIWTRALMVWQESLMLRTWVRPGCSLNGREKHSSFNSSKLYQSILHDSSCDLV